MIKSRLIIFSSLHAIIENNTHIVIAELLSYLRRFF